MLVSSKMLIPGKEGLESGLCRLSWPTLTSDWSVVDFVFWKRQEAFFQQPAKSQVVFSTGC